MSLITLRNTNGQSPSTFENDFNNTFEIEPNSEVALQAADEGEVAVEVAVPDVSECANCSTTSASGPPVENADGDASLRHGCAVDATPTHPPEVWLVARMPGLAITFDRNERTVLRY